MTDQIYCYPPKFTVLRNKLGIRDAATLDRAERQIVRQRTVEGVPGGDFDLAHLQKIHRHLFQDLYAWAGEIRTVEIRKDRQQFQFVRFIETGMNDVHRRIVEARYFQSLGPDEFALQVGPIMGDVNYVHPFREGNGRTQLQYLKQLAARAGHRLDLEKVEQAPWMKASRLAHGGDYGPISRSIRDAIAG